MSWRRAAPRTPLDVVVAVLVVAGVVVRVLILVSPLRYVDADEAVLGLMADDMLDGEFTTFFWGQDYGGMHEPFLIAVLMLLRVPRFLAVKLVPVALFVLGAVLVWRVGRRVAGESAGRLAGVLFWAFPVGVVWMSTKERGYYGAVLVLGLAALLLALRLVDGWRRRDAVGLGLVAGSAWYASPQSLYFLAPVAVWLLARVVRRRQAAEARRLAPLLAGGLLLGALPWIVANLDSGFDSLRIPPGLPESSARFRFKIFWNRGLPVASGFMHPFRADWFGGRAGIAVFVVALLALAAGLVVLWRRERPAFLLPLVLTGALYPALFTAFPTSFYLEDPRYVTFLPAVALVLLAWILVRSPVVVRVGGLALLAVLGVRGTAAVLDDVDAYQRWDVAPGDLAPLEAALADEGVDRVFADYWIAHRLDFETDERVVAAPLQDVRHLPYEAEVRSARAPAYVTYTRTVHHDRVRDHLRSEGVPHRYRQVGDYGIWLPETRVLPEQISFEFWEARARDGVETVPTPYDAADLAT